MSERSHPSVQFVSQLLQKGNTVFAGTRSGRVDAKLGSNDKLEVLPIDVTEPESIAVGSPRHEQF